MRADMAGEDDRGLRFHRALDGRYMVEIPGQRGGFDSIRVAFL